METSIAATTSIGPIGTTLKMRKKRLKLLKRIISRVILTNSINGTAA